MGGSSSIFEFLTGLEEGCPTLMRTPVVKRQTPPMSGFFCFPLSEFWRSQQSVSCSDLISV
jgi:hypothetical protein